MKTKWIRVDKSDGSEVPEKESRVKNLAAQRKISWQDVVSNGSLETEFALYRIEKENEV